jgi:signal peptidase I
MDDQQEPGSVTSAQTPESDAKSSAPEPGESDSGAKAGKPKKKKSFARELLTIVVAAAVLTLLVKAFLVQVYRIPSASMENTLQIGDRVLVNKVVYHFRDIARGDVIVFSGQDSWGPDALPPPSNPLVRGFDDVLSGLGLHSDQTYYIKRVIGVPGDHIVCCNSKGQIKVNGVALSESSYVFPGERPSQEPFSVVVPPGRLWVMGDHREESADSRLHDCAYSDPEVTCVPYDRDGTIPENMVIGRAFMIVWPPSRFRVLPIPATFDQAKLVKADGGRASPAGLTSAALAKYAAGMPIKPSAPYLPLGLGFAGAVPLTLAERWLRIGAMRRRHRQG